MLLSASFDQDRETRKPFGIHFDGKSAMVRTAPERRASEDSFAVVAKCRVIAVDHPPIETEAALERFLPVVRHLRRERHLPVGSDWSGQDGGSEGVIAAAPRPAFLHRGRHGS
jgi:hypothetical protein